MDGHRAHEHCTNRKAQCNHDHIIRQRKGPNYTVKTEAGIKHIEVEEPAKSAADHRALQPGRLLLHLEDCTDPRNRNEGDQAENSRNQERQRIGRIEQRRDSPQCQQQDGDFRGGKRCKFAQPFFQHADPVHLLVLIEEKLEPDHGQECPAKARDSDMCGIDNAFVLLRIIERECDRFNRTQTRRNGHDG
ncbi:MAG: hypothetical protein A3J40_02015 [Erythrobacter sp. RIFCSPHIGHO2_12_FULL_63_10]|nr:MAG: hypothetical protein A3J40_02015 [Erythrobacter sp. RIFCSPHIGHO2_12_FULL_63_10]